MMFLVYVKHSSCWKVHQIVVLVRKYVATNIVRHWGLFSTPLLKPHSVWRLLLNNWCWISHDLLCSSNLQRSETGRSTLTSAFDYCGRSLIHRTQCSITGEEMQIIYVAKEGTTPPSVTHLAYPAAAAAAADVIIITTINSTTLRLVMNTVYLLVIRPQDKRWIDTRSAIYWHGAAVQGLASRGVIGGIKKRNFHAHI